MHSIQIETAQRPELGSATDGSTQAAARRTHERSRGFTLYELALVALGTLVLTAVAIPTFNRSMTNMRVNSQASAIAGAISQTRYSSIMNSQIYTLVLTVPANTYVVNNVTTSTSGSTIPLPSTQILINGGTSATFTYTFCPNGTVRGSGGACPGNSAPPALQITAQGRQVNINVSGVGNVTTTLVK